MKFIYKIHFIIVCIYAVSHLACTQHQRPRLNLKVIQQIGGAFLAVCPTPQYIHLKKSFGYLSLSLNHGLKLKEAKVLPIFRLSDPNRENITDHHKSISSPSNTKDRVITTLNDPCPDPQAWLPLNKKFTTTWHKKTLTLTPQSWQWGDQKRSTLTQPYDIIPAYSPHPLFSINSRLTRSNLTRPPQLSRYVIASEYGLWTWKTGQVSPRQESLPSDLPRSIKRIAQDGAAWWLTTGQEGHYQVWPLSLFNGLNRILAPPQSRTKLSKTLLVSLSKRALKGKKDGLHFTWLGYSFPTPPLQSICLLSKGLPQEFVVIASNKLISIYYDKDHKLTKRPQQIKPRLELFATLELPSSTETILCGDQHLLLLGKSYGLLSIKATKELRSLDR